MNELDGEVPQGADVLNHGLFRSVIADQGGQASAKAFFLRLHRSVTHRFATLSPVQIVTYLNRSGRTEFALAPNDFGGQSNVGLRARAGVVIKQHGFSIRRGFGNPDVARYDRLVDLVAQYAPDIFRHLFGEIVAPVEHGQDDSLNGEPRIEGALHPLDRFDQLAEPLQREELALQWNEDGVSSTKGIYREQIERWRAVHENVAVATPCVRNTPLPVNGICEPVCLPVELGELEFCAQEIHG